MSEPLLRVKNVSKRYCRDLRLSLLHGMEDIGRECLAMEPREGLRKNEFWANKEISFDLHRGECLGLIGSNGAGKSTLLKLIAGLTKPDEGSIEVNGRIGALIELGAGFNPLLTGRENIYINGAVLGMSKREVDRKFASILEFADIDEFIEAPVQSYSSGMKVRLGFAIAVHMEPEILLIDEVLAVGDAAFRNKCFHRIENFKKQNAVIFVSHSNQQISNVTTSAILLKEGSVNYHGKTSEALKHYSFASRKTEDVNTELEILNSPVNRAEIYFLPEQTDSQKGTRLHLKIDSSRELGSLCLRLKIQNSNRVTIAEWNSDFNESEINLKRGLNEVSVELRPLQLKPGKYDIDAVLFEKESPANLFWLRKNEILSIDGYYPRDTCYQLISKIHVET